MKRLTVIIPPSVWDQIDQQVLHIAGDSINRALAWETRLRAAIENLGDVFGHATDQDASARLGYAVRKSVFEKTYLIHYWVDETAGVVRSGQFPPRRPVARGGRALVWRGADQRLLDC